MIFWHYTAILVPEQSFLGVAVLTNCFLCFFQFLKKKFADQFFKEWIQSMQGG
jgi:hypothetical protein